MSSKVRLDLLLVERGLVESREQARRLIMAGEVLADGQPLTKAGDQVSPQVVLTLRSRPPFVSRGGEKLAAALVQFQISLQGAVCADVGASTGGFTDCMLQNGAERVYAIDVGYGQLAWPLRQDQRVINMERTNVRAVPSLPEAISFFTVDVSFISIRLVLPVVRGWLAEGAQGVVLVKPQFEAGKGEVGKGGVVRSAEVHRRVLQTALETAALAGFSPLGLMASPLKGPAGNVEFLMWLGTPAEQQPSTYPGLIEAALDQAARLG